MRAHIGKRTRASSPRFCRCQFNTSAPVQIARKLVIFAVCESHGWSVDHFFKLFGFSLLSVARDVLHYRAHSDAVVVDLCAMHILQFPNKYPIIIANKEYSLNLTIDIAFRVAEENIHSLLKCDGEPRQRSCMLKRRNIYDRINW